MVQLIELLGNKNVVKVLSFFFRNQTKEFSQIGLIKNTKIAKATMVKWLKMMVNEETLLMSRVGVTNLYRLNNESNLVKYLKIISTLAELEPLKELSKKYGISIYLYGSSARGEDVEKSDVDLLVIGKPDKASLARETGKIAERIKKEIKTQIFSQQEWSLMARKDSAFYERVEKDKVKL